MNTVIVGLGFGDEGKGTVVDFLTHRTDARYIIRYNGGPQAAHHVVMPDGSWHCFSQFGSGTFQPGCRTYLSRYMLLDPLALEAESEALAAKGIADPLARLCVSPGCLLVTPFHMHINRMREIARGSQRYGSCGKGVGEAMRDRLWLGEHALVAGDLGDEMSLFRKLTFLLHQKLDIAEQFMDQHSDNPFFRETLGNLRQPDYVEKLVAAYQAVSRKMAILPDEQWQASLSEQESIIWEGAQGTLLDPNYGFAPFVTQTRTTTQNAQAYLSGVKNIRIIGVLRAYATRHGPGPFVTYDPDLTRALPDVHNTNNPWQGAFRVGWFDLVAAKYALALNGTIDGLAITNLDRLRGRGGIRVCIGYYPPDDVHRDILEKLFVLDKNGTQLLIRDILIPANPDQQQALTKILFRCAPSYIFLSEEARLLEIIEQNLNVPIWLISTGATVNDKRQRFTA